MTFLFLSMAINVIFFSINIRPIILPSGPKPQRTTGFLSVSTLLGTIPLELVSSTPVEVSSRETPVNEYEAEFSLAIHKDYDNNRPLVYSPS